MLVGPQVEEVRVVEERSFNLSCRVSVPVIIDSKVRTSSRVSSYLPLRFIRNNLSPNSDYPGDHHLEAGWPGASGG